MKWIFCHLKILNSVLIFELDREVFPEPFIGVGAKLSKIKEERETTAEISSSIVKLRKS